MAIRLTEAAKFLGVSLLPSAAGVTTGKLKYSLSAAGQRVFKPRDLWKSLRR